MPWVRLHALKDYLDMPLHAATHDNVKVTFNLVPSLIDQLEFYIEGGTDRHLELTEREAADLTDAEKLEILTSFFSAHVDNMIAVHPRYNELYLKQKQSAEQTELLPQLFSSSEIRDLQVWSNLAWVDPMFQSEEPIASLLSKQRHFTEEDKVALVAWQRSFLARIVPTYRDLYAQGKIDISFTPQYHPILPLLCDTDSAKEALPGIHLPKERFAHPEDASRQVAMATELFEQRFGQKLKGMWPSEGSISEESLKIISDNGIYWAASDEEVLNRSLAKSGLSRAENPQHRIYQYEGVKLFFRDHALSDRIGFVYSGWPAVAAVDDFCDHILRLRELYLSQLENIVIPIILDGENAWEYFPDDATEFLKLFYQRLSDDELIETVSMTGAAEQLEATKLANIYAGSWINHNFRIWIGHEEDNLAWDMLTRARNSLTSFEKENPDYDSSKIEAAWTQIFIAEGSDWCWWYGDEHRSAHNAEFDRIFRGHLVAMYNALGLDTPMELSRPIHALGAASYVVMPDDILTAQIDGRVSHFYEWTGAGYYDCLKAGGAMHRVLKYLAGIHFAYDHNRFYIRLDFHDRNGIDLLAEPEIRVALFTPGPQSVNLRLSPEQRLSEVSGQYQFALGDILELALERKFLWPDGFGRLSFTVSLYDGQKMIESWPDGDPITLDIPQPHRELFWPS